MHFSNFNDIVSHLDNLLHNLRNLHDVFFGFIDWNKLFNDSLDWNWNLHRNYNGSFNLYYVLSIDVVGHYFFYFDFSGYFSHNLNDLFLNDVMGENFLLIYGSIHHSISDDLNWLLNLNVNVFGRLNLNWPLLNHWNLDNFLHLSNDLLHNLLLHWDLHNLRNLNNLFYYSWNHNNFLYDLLDFNHLRNFHHLLNDLIDSNSDLLDLFNDLRDLDDLLLNVLDGPWDIDIVVDYLVNLNDLRFVDDDWIVDLHFYDLSFDQLLNNCLSDDFWNLHHTLMNHGNFNPLLDYFLHLLDQRNWHINYLLDLLNTILNNNSVPDHFNFPYLLLDGPHLNDFFNNLWNLHNSLLSLDDGNWLLDNFLNDLVLHLNIRNHLLFDLILHSIDYLFDYFLHLYYLRHLNNFLYNSFDESRNLHNPFHNSFHGNNLFHFDSHFPNFRNHVIDLPLNLNNSVFLDNLFNHSIHFNDFGNLSNEFNMPLSDTWDLHYFLYDLFNRNNLLHNVVNYFGNLNWNINNLLDLPNLFDFDDLLNYFFNWHNLRNFNDSVYDLLNYLLHLYYLGHDSEYLENIVHVDDTHNLLVDHSNNPLIHLRNVSCPQLEFLKLFQKSLNQDSKMELHFSRLFA